MPEPDCPYGCGAKFSHYAPNSTTKMWKCASFHGRRHQEQSLTCWIRCKDKRIAGLEAMCSEIQDLCEALPGGIDYGADPMNTSPADMTTHIGGLIWQKCETEKTGDEQ